MTVDSRISEILATSKTIAVVGLSPRHGRPSHGVAAYMQANRFRIIPVNPTSVGTYILGEYCYASLTEAAAALAKENIEIDIVDCFRRPEDIPPIVSEAVKIKAKCLWMQLGIINEAAAEIASATGMQVVMNRCLEIEHANWSRPLPSR
jgi:uncharacterized protein